MADINTIKNQLNVLGYGTQGQTPVTRSNPNMADASGNLILNGKSDYPMVTAIRLFQATHGLIVNGLLGAGTIAALTQAYNAKESAATALANQQASGQPIAYLTNGPSGAVDTAGNTVASVPLPQWDANGNLTSEPTISDPTDPVPAGGATTAHIAAAQSAAQNMNQNTAATLAQAQTQAAQVAALVPGAAGSPGGYPGPAGIPNMQGMPGGTPGMPSNAGGANVIPYSPPPSGLPWWAWGGFGLVAFGGIAAVQAAKKKKLAKAAGH
jgi:hypothetical protein